MFHFMKKGGNEKRNQTNNQLFRVKRSEGRRPERSVTNFFKISQIHLAQKKVALFDAHIEPQNTSFLKGDMFLKLCNNKW